MAVLRLTGATKDYAWAHPDAINTLIGAPASPAIAEVWLGAHPGGPATVGDRSLLDAIDADPEAMLGAAVVDRFGRLPYLPKLLAAGSPLSIQTHPDLETARQGFALEEAEGVPRDAPNRNYRDDNHKPELICAVTEFDALCGFRSLAACRSLFDDLGTDALAPVRDRLAADGSEAEVLAETLTLILSLDHEVAATMLDAAVAEIGRARPGSMEAEWLPKIADAYPGDPGGLVALLLNPVRLAPGQAIFLGAGNLHAYLHGLGVEVMANSDNVIRGGLTPKHIDIPELTRVVDATPLAVDDAVQEGVDGRYSIPVPEFSLRRVELDDSSVPVGPGPVVVIVTEGDVGIGDERFGGGESAFVPATDTVAAEGTGIIFLVGVGDA